MTNLREVAAMAAVAPSTVSRVINNAPNIAPETRAIVQNAIKQLGYTRNRPGRPLRGENVSASQRRTHRIMLLAPGIKRAEMNSPIYIELIHGVESALAKAGKAMILRHLPSGAKHNGNFFSQKLDGVVLFGSDIDDDLRLQLKQLPCVQMMGLIGSDIDWDLVHYSNHRIGSIAADYLHMRGHRKVAIVLQTAKYQTFKERLDVFKSRVRSNGGTCLEYANESLLIKNDEIQKGSKKAIQLLFDNLLNLPKASRPTGVFLTADILAPVFYYEMQRRGLIPGTDLDVISCNNEQSLLAHLHSRPATIDIHAGRVGRKAVEQLLWRMEHPDSPRSTLTLDPTLVEASEDPDTTIPTLAKCES